MMKLFEYINQRIRSFGYAFKGMGVFFKTQAHAKIHLLATGVIVGLGLYNKLDLWEWCAIWGCIGLVLALEAVNTAIEFLTDLASPDYHPLAGKAKDVAAGAVLLAVICCGVVWGLIFIPRWI